MKHYFFTVISIITLTFFYNCSKSDNGLDNEDNSTPKEETEETFNYTSSAKYNLNIIYFVPKGSKNRKDSHRRLSEILLQGQEFYKKNMNDYGFGNKTFNLLVDTQKKRIKITYIDGKLSASNYPYEGGGNKMITEIEAYYNANPDEKNSDHYLVLSPVSDPTTSDVPYYGLGKWCFASDFDDMDIKHLGTGSSLGTRATTYIGGLLHELGHGLNLPHNKEKVSDLSNSNKGTCLMGAGNYTYGSSPTFLSEASCSILNNNQVFNNSNDIFYTGATASIKNLQASFESNNIKISGTVETDVTVNSISIYNDPADDNADYDAVTWATKLEADNTFSINMPISELHKKENTEYVLRLLLNHTSGDITRISYAYKFVNGAPVIDFGEKDYFNKSKWVIESFSSEENSGQENTGLASAILDNNDETYWHSCWNGSCASDNYPHSISIDTGETITAEGFAFTQRKTLSRAIKDIEIFISDDNTTWTSLGNYTLQNVNTVQNIRLDNQASFRYFRIEAKSSYDGDRFAALAEVYCF